MGNVEQAKSGRIKQTLNEQYKAKDKEVKKSMRRNKTVPVWVDEIAKSAKAAAGQGRGV